MQRGSNMMPPNGQQQAANPAFQQLQRPPSRTASPSNIMTQPSPSMTNRQPAGIMPTVAHEASLNAELLKIPSNLLASLRAELGLAEKETQHFTLDDKVSALSLIFLNFFN